MVHPRVLSFDLDDTLWPVGPVIAAAESELFAWLRERCPRAVRDHDVETMRALRATVAAQFPERVHDLTFLRRHALGIQLREAGYEDMHAEAAFEVFAAARNRVSFYPDVHPALERLRRRHRLFALSNGNADLGRCGIAHFFDGHVTARGAGAAKPDARIFAALAARAGVDPGNVVHIGDDPLADVVGATDAGMQAVWINRDARRWPDEWPPPARIITSLDELAAGDVEC
jgi:putative hydrolase of the HAD superfamily